jgi:hypothetical protein
MIQIYNKGKPIFRLVGRAVLYPKEMMIWVIFLLPTTRQKTTPPKKGKTKSWSIPKEPLQISKSYIGTY